MSEQVRFHRSLYDVAGVRAAVEAFDGLARFTTIENPQDVLVIIDDPADDVRAVIADELANYALHESIARAREEASR